jgi:hypothetical protein
MQQIRQAITGASLFLELQQWCKNGAGQKRDVLRIMSAFASGPAVEALEPFFDVFLSDGNFIDIIVGIDRNGTTRDAITRLYELQQSYATQLRSRVFHAPSNLAIFHPKLYLHRAGDRLSAIVGSGNLTLGGLGHNFESLFLYRDISARSNEAMQLLNAWTMFADPDPPLKKQFLRTLTRDYARKLIRTLPSFSLIEGQNTRNGVRALWKPISTIHLPRSRAPVQKAVRVPNKQIRAFLLIDVLTETRQTQMQLPLAVVEEFFGLARNEEGDIQLSQIRSGHITQPIERRIVKSSGKQQTRLMRRLEMPQIAGRARPLAAIFLRLARRHFAMAVAARQTANYRVINRLLSKYGQQPEYAKRRYYVGTASDHLFPSLRPVLGSTELSPVQL